MTEQLLAQLPEMEQEAEALERRAEAIRQIVSGIRALNGEVGLTLFNAPARQLNGNGGAIRHRNGLNGGSRDIDADGPRGREAVQLIMAERPGTWTIKRIKATAKERGWPSSPKAIETAVHRLHRDGTVIWVRKGVYKLADQGEEVA